LGATWGRTAAAVAVATWVGACGGGAGTPSGGAGGGSGGGGGPPGSCVALDLSGAPVGPQPIAPCSGCTCTSIGYVPLDDLGTGTYQGFEGGLYCERSEEHTSELQSQSKLVCRLML